MRGGETIAVIIPALNEAPAIGCVIADIPAWVDCIIVADNGSTDGTADVARAHGALVVLEPRRGYGAACLAAIATADGLPSGPPGILVFMDGDYADHADEMASLVDPIITGAAEFVVGSRPLGHVAPGGLTPQQRFGNALACWLMRVIWGRRHTDLGPYRAIRAATLARLGMADRDYGWTVEMQIEAARREVPTVEVPVSTRRRIGRSKVSGTVRGVVLAGTKILWVIARSAWRDRRR